jgi:hypothetical protein
MKFQFRLPAALLIAAALLGVTATAHAGYFVRPFLSLGGSVVDGLEQNGATQRTENFSSLLRAEVSLNQGTIRNYLELTGPGNSGQAAGVMGDRLTFRGASGTTVDFGFRFDGNIQAPARDPALGSTLQIGVFANLFVFDASANATYANFNELPGALVSQTRFLQFNNPSEPLDLSVLEDLMGSVDITVGGANSFDVFYSLSVFASLNGNPGTVTMDFLNTGTARVGTAPGVSFSSDSGVFPGSTDAPGLVSEPAIGALLALGLWGAVVMRRRIVL